MAQVSSLTPNLLACVGFRHTVVLPRSESSIPFVEALLRVHPEMFVWRYHKSKMNISIKNEAYLVLANLQLETVPSMGRSMFEIPRYPMYYFGYWFESAADGDFFYGWTVSNDKKDLYKKKGFI